jgi:hypothetical protein
LYDHDAANLDILQTDSCGVEPWDTERRLSDFPTKMSLPIGWKQRKLDQEGRAQYKLMDPKIWSQIIGIYSKNITEGNYFPVCCDFCLSIYFYNPFDALVHAAR